jgi:hypothetical protein
VDQGVENRPVFQSEINSGNKMFAAGNQHLRGLLASFNAAR